MATTDRLLGKSNKAVLQQGLEKNFKMTEKLSSPSACLIDVMGLTEKLKMDHVTLSEVSDVTFNRAQSLRINVVFKIYSNVSIKQAGRVKRGEGRVYLKKFFIFLKDSESKNTLISFQNDG